MRIAIDIDSTLHHYWDQFSDVVRRRWGVDLPVRGPADLGDRAARARSGARRRPETHSPPLVAAAVPYPGAVKAVNDWHAAGHFIHITSHRSTDSHDATVAWLDAIGLAHDELYCSYDKITRCREIGIDVLVDDSPVNLERALEEGIIGATIVHPWNRELVRGRRRDRRSGLGRASKRRSHRCSAWRADVRPARLQPSRDARDGAYIQNGPPLPGPDRCACVELTS